MSEVKRYVVDCNRLWEGGKVQAEVDVSVVLATDFDRVTAERDALQARLNAADQKDDDLETQNNLLRHDLASCLETFAAICTKLGIDVEAAKEAGGKPSDVFVAHVNNLAFQLNDRESSRYSWFQAAQAAEKRVEVLEGLLRDIRQSCELSKVRDAQIDAALSASAEPKCQDGGMCGDSSHKCSGCAPVERDERAELSAKNQQLSGFLRQALAALNPRGELAKAIKAALDSKATEGESHE